MSLPNLFSASLRKSLSVLYGDAPAPATGTKKAALQGGFKEETNDMASVQQNPQMEIPLRKARGSDWVRITPEIAQYWLTYNTTNRALVQKKVDQYVSDMEEGHWNNDGSPIRFAHGKLLDGQHRLTAIALTGVTLQMLVVHGLDSEVQVTMDTNRGRTPRDVLSIEGMNPWASQAFGTAVHGLISVEKGLAPSNSVRYTNREVRDFYLEHQSEVASAIAALCDLPRKPAILSFSRALTMHVLFARHDREMADTFFHRLYVGDGLSKSSPIFHLRQRLLNDIVSKAKRSAFLECAFLVKAWNGFRGGSSWKTQQTLYVRDGDLFPEIK